MTFHIANTRVENNQIVVFYEFANGEVNSNTFPLTANFVEIMAWGTARAEFFVQREVELEVLRNQLVEEVVDGDSNLQE
jgi:hypothetical protein